MKLSPVIKGLAFICWFPLTSIPAPRAQENPALTATTDLSQWEGKIIDSVLIDNRNIYDTSDPEYQNFVFRLANRFHVITSTSVIKRELLLTKGKVFSQELADETARSLRQRLILYDAWIEVEELPNGHLLVRVITIDQWSLGIGMDLNHEGNETKYRFGVREKNFLGFGQNLAFHFTKQSVDADFIEADFSDSRLFGYPISVGAAYTNNPSLTFSSLNVQHPYYNLSQGLAYSFSVTSSKGRSDVYRDTVLIGRSFGTADILDASIVKRFGTYERKYGFGLNYSYRYETFGDKQILSAEHADSMLVLAGFPEDSLYHQVGVALNFAGYDFLKTRKIDGFDYTEDFVLGPNYQLTVDRAFDLNFDGRLYDLGTLSLSESFSWKTNLVFTSFRYSHWFKVEEVIRRQAALSLYFYNNHLPFLTFAGRMAYLSDWNRGGVDFLVLGGTTGVRGVDKYFRTGNRRVVLNLESRFFTGLRLLSVSLGMAAFVDAGNIWKTEEKFSLKRGILSVGGGFRLAFAKSSKSIIRIDAAYSNDKQWALSIGTGQYFGLSSGN